MIYKAISLYDRFLYEIYQFIYSSVMLKFINNVEQKLKIRKFYKYYDIVKIKVFVQQIKFKKYTDSVSVRIYAF